ncbi:CarD family transcriptional regulator [Actinobaculum suis]|uniref:CarD family transcriptional regulator n=1 Tax=Actinobaculum suis TaxID=1657 RepID=A0A0K9ESU3_9ACTO|nr:CarD family transcriptional regulator [Actinobaculum suis]KMY23269.1 CarD family transcriptional regulator [Actinobaculum suis]MDY5153704.1 CarD family transcriptional regulator [Actinobaculum suis]OCA95347.1 CarD family transcriptional regulator [Actinobaculum suis]OCA95932.1 CarD family transcriptional regulator [Actinobaculum suis]SDE62219.1 CarD family transcriptional regulator [Actinobaculum suis]
MPFKVGETVIYPHHGAAEIIDISDKVIRGEKRRYLTLNVTQSDMVIQVPEASLEEVGVRDVSNEEQLQKVFDVLRAVDIEEPSNWSRRYKANSEKLSSGDVMKVAEVVRDLTRRDRDRHLSAGEKRMLQQARGILGSEVALARELSEEDTDALLDEILEEGAQAAAKAAAEKKAKKKSKTAKK